MEAAHVVFAPLLGLGWCLERLFVIVPSGRQRFHVLAVLYATTLDLFWMTTLTDITSETVCELRRLLADTRPGVLSTLVLDKTSNQRGALVQRVAQRRGIA